MPIDKTGYSETFHFCCFHPTDYVLMLTLDHQELDSVTMLGDWDRTERRLTAAFDVVLALELRDLSGNTLITHQGGLDDWKLTNAPAREGTDGGFWKYRFDARFLEKYQFKVSVVRGNVGAKEFDPTLLFHGVGDGYFWLVRIVYNAMWGVLVGVAAIIGLVVQFIRRRHAT